VHPDADVLKKHPDWLLLNADGSSRKISFWNGWYMCPAHSGVAEHHRSLVIKILRDWGYDGLKLDGMHMNGAPLCYNAAHRHKRPEDAVEAMPEFFRMIFETARSIKPDAVIEWCPCGTSYNFFTLPHMNMSVASDPRSSFQIRSKGKTLKALHGDGIAYFGDHVELSTGRDDFASTVGVGGVIGTNFTWPPGSAPRNRQDLTPEKEKYFSKWIGIYKDKMLSRGEYLGTLYDIGFDRPETHAIRKGASLYYAIFAPDWKGGIELRGLAPRSYRLTDYVEGKDLGTVRGPVGRLNVEFRRHLLLEARPE
jgi:alpha-galactosidase